MPQDYIHSMVVFTGFEHWLNNYTPKCLKMSHDLHTSMIQS